MLSYVKWSFWIVFWVLIVAFFHYTLPQNDIVRINQADNRVVAIGENAWFWAQQDAGNAASTERDVRFIRGAVQSGDVVEYRNEDTGLWGWPPYFKINSDTIQSRAADWQSTSKDPVWVAIKHYGWRSNILSTFPNVLSVKQVDGPDVRIIPWTTIIVLTVFGCIVWGIYARVLKFRRNRIDPLLDGVEDGISSASGWFGRG